METEKTTPIPKNELTDAFMTEDEMCAFLGVNKVQLNRLRNSTGMPYVRITPYRRLYPVADLKVWMADRVWRLNQG